MYMDNESIIQCRMLHNTTIACRQNVKIMWSSNLMCFPYIKGQILYTQAVQIHCMQTHVETGCSVEELYYVTNACLAGLWVLC